jgi:hypothetical protein
MEFRPDILSTDRSSVPENILKVSAKRMLLSRDIELSCETENTSNQKRLECFSENSLENP